jgi:hypothetical protein
MTNIDINPFPLGAIAPTSGTPLNLLTNVPDLALTRCKVITVFAPSGNTGNVYVGRSTLNKTTLAGVLLVLEAGETKALPFDQSAGNVQELSKYFVDVDTTGDKALVDALFA